MSITVRTAAFWTIFSFYVIFKGSHVKHNAIAESWNDQSMNDYLQVFPVEERAPRTHMMYLCKGLPAIYSLSNSSESRVDPRMIPKFCMISNGEMPLYQRSMTEIFLPQPLSLVKIEQSLFFPIHTCTLPDSGSPPQQLSLHNSGHKVYQTLKWWVTSPNGFM